MKSPYVEEDSKSPRLSPRMSPVFFSTAGARGRSRKGPHHPRPMGVAPERQIFPNPSGSPLKAGIFLILRVPSKVRLALDPWGRPPRAAPNGEISPHPPGSLQPLRLVREIRVAGAASTSTQPVKRVSWCCAGLSLCCCRARLGFRFWYETPVLRDICDENGKVSIDAQVPRRAKDANSKQ